MVHVIPVARKRRYPLFADHLFKCAQLHRDASLCFICEAPSGMSDLGCPDSRESIWGFQLSELLLCESHLFGNGKVASQFNSSLGDSNANLMQIHIANRSSEAICANRSFK